MGYGPPGLFPGFQGFGLGYQLGYGYGGSALGVGAEGGYPFYGGPGYPHPWPKLSRHMAINPFCYFGGPGYPTPDHPNFYGGIGALAVDKPVITVGDDDYGSGFGGFTGAIPYSEAVLAPFTTRAGAEGTSGGAAPYYPAPPPTNPTPGTSGSASPPGADRNLGIDSDPVAESGGVKGMKVSKVYAGSAAEQAGLRAGDVIVSANDYVTAQLGNLEWIIANAATDDVLLMNVRTASDNRDHAIKARLR